jgi:hypothetical protein
MSHSGAIIGVFVLAFLGLYLYASTKAQPRFQDPG